MFLLPPTNIYLALPYLIPFGLNCLEGKGKEKKGKKSRKEKRKKKKKKKFSDLFFYSPVPLPGVLLVVVLIAYFTGIFYLHLISWVFFFFFFSKIGSHCFSATVFFVPVSQFKFYSNFDHFGKTNPDKGGSFTMFLPKCSSFLPLHSFSLV